MPPPRIRRIAVVLALVAAASLDGEVKVLKNFTLIDGTGRPALPASAMIIDNGRISWIGPAAELKAPAGAETSVRGDLCGKELLSHL